MYTISCKASYAHISMCQCNPPPPWIKKSYRIEIFTLKKVISLESKYKVVGKTINFYKDEDQESKIRAIKKWTGVHNLVCPILCALFSVHDLVCTIKYAQFSVHDLVSLAPLQIHAS